MNDDTKLPPMFPATQVVHPGLQIPPDSAAFSHVTHRAPTMTFKNLVDMRAFDSNSMVHWRYSLYTTSASDTPCRALAQIEGGSHTLLLPSGLAAISPMYFTFIKSGDDVLTPDNVYGPNRDRGEWMIHQFDTTVHYYDPMISAGIANLVRHNTKLVWLEASGSVTMEVPDCTAIAEVACRVGAIMAIDNTRSRGVCYQSFKHGIDISIQALTKYQSDGSDVFMSAVVMSDEALHHKLLATRICMGWGISADDYYFVLRGLPNLPTRLAAHDAYTREVAGRLTDRSEVVCVLHPTLPDHPGHENRRRDSTGVNGLFSVMLHRRYSQIQTDTFIEGLHYFTIGFSWGGAHSLALLYNISSMRTATIWPPADWEDVNDFVRPYIRLEDPRGLIADLEQAMEMHLGV